MSLFYCSLIQLFIILVLASRGSNCEKLNTVFILESSEPETAQQPSPSYSSSSSVIEASEASSAALTVPKVSSKSLNHEETNTRIITDEGGPKSAAKQQDSPIVVRPHSSQTPGRLNQQQSSSHGDTHIQRDDSEKEESQAASSTQRERIVSGNLRNNQPKPRSTTSTTSNYYDSAATTPKSEERLLISITSNDDYSSDYAPNKQTQKQPHDQAEYQPQVQQAQSQPPKRKPQITISIQDPNAKQSGGGGGTQAVIVRPSENGQSIVIATVDSNKFNQNNNNPKPSFQNEPPYSQQVQSSTHRPPTGNEYGSPYSSQRPVVSTSGQRPPHVSAINADERPQRPTVVLPPNDDSNYEQVRPTPRPPINNPQQGYEPQGGATGGEQQPFSNGQQQQQQQQQGGAETRFPLNEKNCGTIHETRIVGGDEANPDDFPWMTAIIKSRPKDGEARPFCGGSLITRRHILTAAHCLESLAPRDVLVRLGSYDFDDSTASSLAPDLAIDQFRVPSNYSKKTHVADIAIMRLKTPLSTNDNYKTVCMPQARRSYVGAYGTVTGYGSQSQTFRRAAPKLRQVTVPIWENRKCSTVYKKNLTESFMCAGYEEGGKDACQGDSGGPLMTEGPNERMMVIGVVSHGIGCGAPGYPGVYTRTSTYLDWIEKNTRE